MRYLTTVILSALFCAHLFSQETKTDSLKRQLNYVKGKDRVDVMVQLSKSFIDEIKLDSSLTYANSAIGLSRQINYPLGETRGILMMSAHIVFSEHNYAKALSNCLYTLPIFEREKDTAYILLNLYSLAIIYSWIDEFPLSIHYRKKQYELAKVAGDQQHLMKSTYYIAEDYENLKNFDSAVIYYQECFKLTNIFASPDSNLSKGRSYLGIARASILLHDYKIALSYLDKAYSYAQFLETDIDAIKAGVQSVYANVFVQLEKWDSALYHIRLSNQVSNGISGGMYDYYGSIHVAKVFEHINKDSAIEYYKIATQVKAAFDSKTRAEFNNLTQAEVDRQRQIRENEALQQLTRRKNIQYTGIAIALGTIIVLFLFYSRSIIGKEKLIRYLGVLLLLIVFEFLNLYLHPFLGHLTNESPLLMLLAMVTIAALLIPAHHRLEHWVSHQLVEKNKRIRLEAAKKTIKQLEG